MIQIRLPWRNKTYLHFGKLRGIAIGFKIDKWGFDLDLIKFYVGIEW
jgi:hypothetical protein